MNSIVEELDESFTEDEEDEEECDDEDEDEEDSELDVEELAQTSSLAASEDNEEEKK